MWWRLCGVRRSTLANRRFLFRAPSSAHRGRPSRGDVRWCAPKARKTETVSVRFRRAFVDEAGARAVTMSRRMDLSRALGGGGRGSACRGTPAARRLPSRFGRARARGQGGSRHRGRGSDPGSSARGFPGLGIPGRRDGAWSRGRGRPRLAGRSERRHARLPRGTARKRHLDRPRDGSPARAGCGVRLRLSRRRRRSLRVGRRLRPVDPERCPGHGPAAHEPRLFGRGPGLGQRRPRPRGQPALRGPGPLPGRPEHRPPARAGGRGRRLGGDLALRPRGLGLRGRTRAAARGRGRPRRRERSRGHVRGRRLEQHPAGLRGRRGGGDGAGAASVGPVALRREHGRRGARAATTGRSRGGLRPPGPGPGLPARPVRRRQPGQPRRVLELQRGDEPVSRRPARAPGRRLLGHPGRPAHGRLGDGDGPRAVDRGRRALRPDRGQAGLPGMAALRAVRHRRHGAGRARGSPQSPQQGQRVPHAREPARHLCPRPRRAIRGRAGPPGQPHHPSEPGVPRHRGRVRDRDRPRPADGRRTPGGVRRRPALGRRRRHLPGARGPSASPVGAAGLRRGDRRLRDDRLPERLLRASARPEPGRRSGGHGAGAAGTPTRTRRSRARSWARSTAARPCPRSGAA